MRAIGLGLALVASGAVADVRTFPRGSLIIPMTSVFQSECGQVSAYGLVYRILQANGPGHRNAADPVTVYMANNSGKDSVNRCKPTNTAVFDGNVPSPNDPKWVDGCDFSVFNSEVQPVVQVRYGEAFPIAGKTYAEGALTAYTSDNVWPSFSSVPTGTQQFTRINYGGAPFIIDVSDAKKVIELLRLGDSGTSAFPKLATDLFTDERTSCWGLDATAHAQSGNLEYSGGAHYVAMHQVTTSFDAPIARRLNKPPTPFALYDPAYGPGTTTDRSDSARGPNDNVLERYLNIAGLWLKGTTNGNDSRGCPVGNVSNCQHNGSTGAGVGKEASEAQARRGAIFDRFSTEDLDYVGSTTYPDGLLNRQVDRANAYLLFWAPHWIGSSEKYGNDAAGVVSIKKFLAKGGNILGECASVATWEDDLKSGNTKGVIGGLSAGSNFLFDGGIYYGSGSNERNDQNKSTGKRLRPESGQRNCSDPGAPGVCVAYPAPGNIFSQVGDWNFNFSSGVLEEFKPKPGRGFHPWTTSMLVLHDSDKNATVEGYNVFAMGQSDPAAGVVVYVGGHDVSDDPLGARIVLNSMVNLSGIPTSSERALAGPTIVSGTDGGIVDQVLTPTYDAIAGYPTADWVKAFSATPPANQKLWVWPYYPGHLRSHAMAALPPGDQLYNTAVLFDAAGVSQPKGLSPLPGARNLFTWLGGYPLAAPPTRQGGQARNNQLQVGWTPETIDGTRLDTKGDCPLSTPASLNCVDVMGLSARVPKALYDDGSAGLHFVVGADQLCDVQEAMYTASTATSGWDACLTDGPLKAYATKIPTFAALLQRVRGYCYATDSKGTVLAPTDDQCGPGDDNRAHLGGLVHSSAAVVEPSAYIGDQGALRPTVAFAGGFDGQLHAIYVGGGSGYRGPSGSATDGGLALNQDNAPTAKFKTDFAAQFASGKPPPAGTELWSYLPASQLPWLGFNEARVDSSPALLDAFADFDGSGRRSWHTVLVQSLGTQSNELFALDVTNPLVPRLLWDITGSLYRNANTPVYSPNILMNGATMADGGTALPGEALAPKFVMSRDSATGVFTERLGAMRQLYDYRDLGGTAGVSVSQIRIGLEPVYVAFVASNISSAQGRQGLEVFAIEAATGQLLWQWERPYVDDAKAPSDNTVPPVPSVITDANGAGRVLVGDQQGRVWELDAATGRNRSFSTLSPCPPPAGNASAPTVSCQFPAFDAQSVSSPAYDPQPITTNIAVARIPSTGLAADAPLAPYAGERVLLFGTAGANWISPASAVAGQVHVVLFEASRRVPVATGTGMHLDNKTPWTPQAALDAAKVAGVLQEPAALHQTFKKGERVYGNITVAGSVAYYTTATERVSDIMQLPASVGGQTYLLNLGTAKNTAIGGTQGAYGGVAVYFDAAGNFQGFVTSQAGSMFYGTTNAVGAVDAKASKRDASLSIGDNQGLTYRLMAWVRRILGL